MGQHEESNLRTETHSRTKHSAILSRRGQNQRKCGAYIFEVFLGTNYLYHHFVSDRHIDVVPGPKLIEILDSVTEL